MKKLNEICNCNYTIPIKGIKTNSQEIVPGDLFVCTKGLTKDRHDYIDDAIKNGASALIVAHEVKANIPYVIVDNPNEELYSICEKFYDYPDKNIKIIGITGTDGKTTTTTIIQTLIGKDKCGIIGTNGRNCAKFKKDTNNTTPDIDKTLMYFKEFIDAGCSYVTMEASSEAFYNNRLKHIEFNTSGYTNISSEHLNVHKTIDNYIECKKLLFEQTSNACILNKDDKYYKQMIVPGKKILTYGKNKDNDLQIVDYKVSIDKTFITYKYNNKNYDIVSPLLGEFNVYNLACALLTVLSMGFNMDDVLKNVKNIYVDGRLEFIDMGQNYKVMVDYAHTPNGIINLLNFIKKLDVKRIIVVSGQAGERDKSKRHLVGAAIIKNASYAILTYEDPRNEDPKDIIEDMLADVKNDYSNYEIVIDRSEAIKKAIDIAKKDDIVLILGKGNETYEKIKNKKIYFNDIEEAKKYLLKNQKKLKITL